MNELPFTTQVKEVSTQSAPKGLMVKVCRAEDTDCLDPEKTFQDLAGTGEVTLLLPWGWTGYLELSSNETLTSLYYMTRPVTEPLRVTSILLITQGLISAGSTFSPEPFDLDQYGLVLAQMLQCSGSPASGIRFEISDPESRQFFLLNNLPSADAALSTFDPATSQTTGSFLNVHPGSQSIRAHLGLDGPLLGQATFNVRPKTISQLQLYP